MATKRVRILRSVQVDGVDLEPNDVVEIENEAATKLAKDDACDPVPEAVTAALANGGKAVDVAAEKKRIAKKADGQDG